MAHVRALANTRAHLQDIMDADGILKDLQAWLETERKYYKRGAMTSIAESVWGERVIRDVQGKIRELMKGKT